MKRKPKVYPAQLYMRFFGFIFFTIFSWKNRIRKIMPSEVKNLKAPYLVLGNHVGFWDPFVTGTFLPEFTRFVASDAAFRSSLFRFFLTRAGTIPKKKNMRDTKVIRDWYNWEEKFLSDMVREKVEKGSQEVIFEDQGSKIYYGATDTKLKFKGEADVLLYTDRLVIKYHNLPEEIMNFDDLQTINPQVYERLEIFYNNHAYRIIGGRPGVSALKWEVAVNTIWKKLGQMVKLSPYINC